MIKIPIKQLNKEDAIYIAGLFDGEGSIMIIKRTKKNIYELKIAIAMTSEKLLQWVHVTAGGSLYRRTCLEKKFPLHKPQWRWVLYGKGAIGILVQLHPYLKLKKLQAEVAFKYQETIKQKMPKGIQGFPKLTDDILMKRKDLYEDLKILNDNRRHGKLYWGKKEVL